MTQHQTEDPFAPSQEKRPSVKFTTVGQSYTLEVASAPKLVQSRDYETGDLATWPDGNPKMSAVIDVTNTTTGEEMGLWAPKPSALFRAIQEAQQSAGQVIAAGGTLVVTYTHDKANDRNPRLNAAKQYSVKYVPPSPGNVADPFAARTTVSDSVTAPSGWAPAGPLPNTGPTAEQVAAVTAAGLNPADVFPGYQA